MNDGQRFGQNLYFSYLDKKGLATVSVDEWHGEIVQYHYVCVHLNLLPGYNRQIFRAVEIFMGKNYIHGFLIRIVRMDGNVVTIQLWFGPIQPMLVAVITFARKDSKPRLSLALTYRGQILSNLTRAKSGLRILKDH